MKGKRRLFITVLVILVAVLGLLTLGYITKRHVDLDREAALLVRGIHHFPYRDPDRISFILGDEEVCVSAMEEDDLIFLSAWNYHGGHAASLSVFDRQARKYTHITIRKGKPDAFFAEKNIGTTDFVLSYRTGQMQWGMIMPSFIREKRSEQFAKRIQCRTIRRELLSEFRMILEKYGEGYSYALGDINMDGSPELMVVTTGRIPGIYDASKPIAIYGLDRDGKPVTILKSLKNEVFEVAQDGTIRETRRNRNGEARLIYALTGDSLQLMEAVIKDEGTGIYRHTKDAKAAEDSLEKMLKTEYYGEKRLINKQEIEYFQDYDHFFMMYTPIELNETEENKLNGFDDSRRKAFIENLNRISELRYGDWEKMNKENKTRLLQALADLEASELDLPNSISIVFGMPRNAKGNASYYDEKMKILYIDADFADTESARECTKAVCYGAHFAALRASQATTGEEAAFYMPDEESLSYQYAVAEMVRLFRNIELLEQGQEPDLMLSLEAYGLR